MRHAVITGIGTVTGIGVSAPEFFRGLIDADRGIRQITAFDPEGLRNEHAGEVRDWSFSAAEFGLSEAPDRATQFLLTAAREAIADAGLPMDGHDDANDAGRAGLSFATNFGGSRSFEEFAAGLFGDEPSPETFNEAMFDTALDHAIEAFNWQGPASMLSTACASGTGAIGVGFDMIRHDRADIVLCAGHDALARTPLAGLSALRTMTADDILPFSANRSGTLFGEGAGAVILEALGHARARGAPFYSEVRGYWQNNNAYHTTAPDPGGHGMRRVLRNAIEDADIKPQQIDYINAHGTGTEYHDPEETKAIKSVLGDHAYEISVSSIKGAIGHLMGAAGLVEAVATVMAMKKGVLPPTLNDGEVDPEMDLDFVVNSSRTAEIRYAASISAGIGGNNACIVLRNIDAGTEAGG